MIIFCMVLVIIICILLFILCLLEVLLADARTKINYLKHENQQLSCLPNSFKNTPKTILNISAADMAIHRILSPDILGKALTIPSKAIPSIFHSIMKVNTIETAARIRLFITKHCNKSKKAYQCQQRRTYAVGAAASGGCPYLSFSSVRSLWSSMPK